MKRLWSKFLQGKKKEKLAGKKSANLYFWRQAKGVKPMGILGGSAALKQMDP